MPKRIINLNIDFNIKNNIQLFKVKQFDDVVLDINTFLDCATYNPNQSTCKLFVGIDNDIFLQNKNIQVKENKITINLDKNIIAKHGRACAELELKDSNGVITSSTFLFNIDKKIGEGATVPGSIEGFVAKYERLIAEFKSQVNETINNCNTNVDNKLNTIDGLINAKISDFEKRFNRLTASQQQDAEVIDAREDFKGKVFDSLKERIDYTDKLLRDSTVSTIETEIDFTVVEATSNGYFEDVKLEGKTLVNIVKGEKGGVKQTLVADGTNKNIAYNTNIALEIGKEYTFITNISKNTLEGTGNLLLANGFTTKPSIIIPRNSIGVVAKKITIGSDHIDRGYHQVAITSNITNGEITFDYYMILEGDHTQNPPSYFEVIKSVGDGVDEIIVSSRKGKGNLFNKNDVINSKIVENGTGNFITPSANVSDWYTSGYIPIRNTLYTIGGLTNSVVSSGEDNFWAIYDKSKRRIHSGAYKVKTGGNRFDVTNIKNAKYFAISVHKSDLDNFYLVESSGNKNEPHKSDKKRLLYYNEETQTWEKPILRKWDSVEKHSDGKYYYHKRSGEVVLNGSETIRINNHGGKSMQFVFDNYPTDIAETTDVGKVQLIADIIPPVSSNDIGDTTLSEDNFGIAVRIKGVIGIFVTIPKSKLTTPDLVGFKQWLQANNVTVVYQLAEEKIYECTNIDLITYDNETNYIIESGAITPKSTLKVHNNISNVVSLLQKKVSVLESNITNYMITQNRLMLASRYNADSVSFKVNVASSRNSVEYDNDLYELILNNILIGKDNYIREYIENLIVFYWMDFVISDEMYSTLFEIIEEQHNPKVIEEAPIE